MSLIRKSIPAKKYVHGIKVEKLSLGCFLDAVESMKSLPSELLQKLFPELEPNEALMQLKYLRPENMIDIFSRAVTVLPDEFVSFFSILLDISPETLRDKLTPSQFMDIVYAFWKINDMGNFIKKAKGAMKALKALSISAI